MNKKIVFTLIFLVTLTGKMLGECVLVPLTLNDRLQASSLVLEGLVISKNSYWNSDKTMILTNNVVQISRIYKGSSLIQSNTISITTLGGQVGLQAIKADPELELETGEIGIFMLVSKDGNWVSESGPQGVIRIDKYTAIASDVFNTWPAFSIQNAITNSLQSGITDINPALTKVVLSSKRAAPTISSISPKSLSAGTSTVLTIKGSNFMSTRDTNNVQFKNGDDGGASYINALKNDYISWSDTMIKVMVRTKAGTGKIRVVAGSNGNVVSNDTLTINFAHLNVVSADTIGYETQEIGMNSNKGITWKISNRFYDSTAARGAFIRSLERWRCGTNINWDTLGTVKFNNIASDGVNLCAWDTSSAMPNGVLAQCFSFWSGCYTPGLKWFVNELDIRFRVKPTNTTNWNYTTGNASNSQFHFESVATHELGHGHQLGHVINSNVVMHYAIANGQTKPTVTTNDINGGSYVLTKSANAICGKNAHVKINPANCSFVTPASDFTSSAGHFCKGETITFKDSSSGNISAWSWNFGANATPATANTQGPHNVIYSAGGSKSVSLTITTLGGTNNKTKTISINTDARITPNFSFSASEKGKVQFTNTSTGGPTSEKWYFGDNDSSVSGNPAHTYATGGSYNVQMNTGNNCSNETVTKSIKFAYLNFGVNQKSNCIDQMVEYHDSSDNNVSTWNWTFSGGTPSSATGKGPHTVKYASAGNYNAKLSITVSGGGNQTFTQNNLVSIGSDTFTTANFNYGYYGKNIVGFENKSKGSNNSYKWYFGDNDSSTQVNPLHTYVNANNQTVVLKVRGNCNNDDTTIVLRNFTNLSDVKREAFTLVPNPNNGSFKIISSEKITFSYEIFDLNGRSVVTGKSQKEEVIQIPESKAGLYFIHINYGSGTENLILNIH